MKPLKFLAALLLMFNGACLITAAQTPTASSSTVCLDEAAARRIDRDLQRYPLTVKESKALRDAIKSHEESDKALRKTIVLKDTALAATQRVANYNDQLYRDADNRASIYQKKASKRGWQNVGLGALALLLGFLAVK